MVAQHDFDSQDGPTSRLLAIIGKDERRALRWCVDVAYEIHAERLAKDSHLARHRRRSHRMTLNEEIVLVIRSVFEDAFPHVDIIEEHQTTTLLFRDLVRLRIKKVDRAGRTCGPSRGRVGQIRSESARQWRLFSQDIDPADVLWVVLGYVPGVLDDQAERVSLGIECNDGVVVSVPLDPWEERTLRIELPAAVSKAIDRARRTA
jgi:hypothetical protein